MVDLEVVGFGFNVLSCLMGWVEELGIVFYIIVDLLIVRGLDYYILIVYEVFFMDFDGFGVVMSGGCYDDLFFFFFK